MSDSQAIFIVHDFTLSVSLSFFFPFDKVAKPETRIDTETEW